MFEILVSFLSSMFICSFSSVLSAAILIGFTVGIVAKMYWTVMSVIPLYLFSLFMLGGLYVLIGFVMMSDVRDLDMIFSGEKFSDFLISFYVLYFIIMVGKNLNSFDLSFIDWSFIKEEIQSTGWFFSSTYVFLMLFLLIYLYIMFSISKGSWGSGGLINN